MNYKQRKIAKRAKRIKEWSNNEVPWTYCKLYARSNAIYNFWEIGNVLQEGVEKGLKSNATARISY